VISPRLAKVYLHYVLDEWFETEARPRLGGRGVLVHYADDAVMCFETRRDAQRVMEVLPKRSERYGLRLHPTKTLQVAFQRPSRRITGRSGRKVTGGFDFLGFRRCWGWSRRGWWVVKRKAAPQRLSRSPRSIRLWCREDRHQPVTWQHQVLCQKIRGHYGYYGITGNCGSLNGSCREVRRAWRKWLSRRSCHGFISWGCFVRLLARLPLPAPAIVQRI